MTTYHEEFADLSAVVLEESWVLRVDDSTRQLRMVLDLVLTPDHPGYGPPRPGEMYCYRRGTLVVDSDTAVHVRQSTRPPTIDPTGETDRGNVDTFGPATDLGADVWELTGEWGEALIRRPRVRVEFHDGVA